MSLLLQSSLLLRSGDGTAAFAPSSLQSPLVPSAQNILVHDDMSGAFAALAINTERTVSPGPGISELRASNGASTTLLYENGKAMLATLPYGNSSSVFWTPTANTGIAAAVGLTMIARVKPHAFYGSDSGTIVGFSRVGTSGDLTYGGVRVSSSKIAYPVTQITRAATANDTNQYAYGYLKIEEDEDVAVMIHYKSLTDIRYGIQCKAVANLGCHVGSDAFFPIGRTVPDRQTMLVSIATACTSNGNLTLTLTSADVTGSPVAYSIPLTTASNTTIKVARAIADCLNAQAEFSEVWEASGEIFLTPTTVLQIRRKTAALHDSTAGFVITNGLGVTTAASPIGTLVNGSYQSRLGGTFDLTGQTVWPVVCRFFDGVVEFKDVKVLSGYTPSGRSAQLGYDRGKLGIHIPSLGRDPVTGLVVCGYDSSTNHVGTDTEIHAAVRKSDGTWTDEQTLVTAGFDHARIIASIAPLDGVLNLFYFKSWTDGDYTKEGGPLFRRTMSINSTTGAITLGAEVNCNMPETYGLYFSPPIQRNGRIIFAYHSGSPSILGKIAYSDDDMATWTTVTLHATKWLAEPSLVIESDGNLGCWMRANSAAGDCAHYSRSTDNGTTWSDPALVPAIPMPSTSGARIHAARRADGSMWLVGNNDTTDRVKVSMWPIADGGVVTGSPVELASPGFSNSPTTNIHQYPDILDDGDDVLIAYSTFSSAGFDSNNAINVHAIRWPSSPVALTSGGTGKRGTEPSETGRSVAFPAILASAATVTPNMTYASKTSPAMFRLSLAHNVTLNPPSNPLPWEKVEIMVVQAASGGPYTLTLGAAWDARSTTTTMSTTANDVNILSGTFNSHLNKWVVTGWT